jgi:hypothetical protein
MTDLLSMLPNNNVRRVVCYCLDELNLSLSETDRVLYDATKIVGAIRTIMSGRRVSAAQPESLGERTE